MLLRHKIGVLCKFIRMVFTDHTTTYHFRPSSPRFHLSPFALGIQLQRLSFLIAIAHKSLKNILIGLGVSVFDY